VCLFDFENREGIFPGIDSRIKFSLVTLGSGVDHAQFAFFLTRTEHLSDLRRCFSLSEDEIVLLNPNTRTAPIFRSRMDAELTKKIYRSVAVLIDESKGETFNPWGITYTSKMFDMTDDFSFFLNLHLTWSERGYSGRD
jgi:hypothetical protein